MPTAPAVVIFFRSPLLGTIISHQVQWHLPYFFSIGRLYHSYIQHKHAVSRPGFKTTGLSYIIINSTSFLIKHSIGVHHSTVNSHGTDIFRNKKYVATPVIPDLHPISALPELFQVQYRQSKSDPLPKKIKRPNLFRFLCCKPNCILLLPDFIRRHPAHQTRTFRIGALR